MANEIQNLIDERDELRVMLEQWNDAEPPGMLERLAELNNQIKGLQGCDSRSLD